MSDNSDRIDARTVSPAGAAINRVLGEAWDRRLTRFVLQPGADAPYDCAMWSGETCLIESLGVDFETLSRRLTELATPKKSWLSGARANPGAFRLRLGKHDVCITVDPNAMDNRMDCGVYVPRDFVQDDQ